MTQMGPLSPQPKNQNQDLNTLILVITGLIGILGLALCCVVVAMVVSTKSGFTLLATATPTSMPTSAVTCPSVPDEWYMKISNTFDYEESNWPVGDSRSAYGISHTWYEDGKYYVSAIPDSGMLTYEAPELPMQQDFYLSVDMQKVSGINENYQGVYFRLTEPNSYFFGFNDLQQYVGWSYIGQWETLIPWTNSGALKPHEVNTITVVAKHAHFDFCINGQWVASMDDERKTIGYVGVFFGTDDVGQETVYAIDNFILYSPLNGD